MATFTSDVETIRSRARKKIEEGAITEAYKGDVVRTIEILNEALATEIVCVLRYMHHYFMATGVHAMSVRDEFKEHADAERDHTDRIADRIQQLGGKPDFNPKSLLERSASQYVEGSNLSEMIKEDLIAERVVIEVYTEMIRYFGDNDPTTNTLPTRPFSSTARPAPIGPWLPNARKPFRSGCAAIRSSAVLRLSSTFSATP